MISNCPWYLNVLSKGKHKKEILTIVKNRMLDFKVSENNFSGINNIGNRDPSEKRICCETKCVLMRVPYMALKSVEEAARLRVASKAAHIRALKKQENYSQMKSTLESIDDMVSALQTLDCKSKKLNIALRDIKANIKSKICSQAITEHSDMIETI